MYVCQPACLLDLSVINIMFMVCLTCFHLVSFCLLCRVKVLNKVENAFMTGFFQILPDINSKFRPNAQINFWIFDNSHILLTYDFSKHMKNKTIQMFMRYLLKTSEKYTNQKIILSHWTIFPDISRNSSDLVPNSQIFPDISRFFKKTTKSCHLHRLLKLLSTQLKSSGKFSSLLKLVSKSPPCN